jgi:hypothetical protein
MIDSVTLVVGGLVLLALASWAPVLARLIRARAARTNAAQPGPAPTELLRSAETITTRQYEDAETEIKDATRATTPAKAVGQLSADRLRALRNRQGKR